MAPAKAPCLNGEVVRDERCLARLVRLPDTVGSMLDSPALPDARPAAVLVVGTVVGLAEVLPDTPEIVTSTALHRTMPRNRGGGSGHDRPILLWANRIRTVVRPRPGCLDDDGFGDP